MDNVETIAALAALAQPTRLDTFRLLVSREPDGVPAGELARLIEVPQNTMSTHLAVLSHAGLVIGERQSRSIIYRANLARFRGRAVPAQGLLRWSSRYMRAHNRRPHAVPPRKGCLS